MRNQVKWALAWVTACFLAVLAVAAIADESPIPGASWEQYCTQWAKNATLGGSQALRGKPRAIIPMKEGAILEMLEHGLLFDQPGVVVWSDEWEDPVHREFIERSVFFGYDYVTRMVAAGKQGELPETAQAATEMFYAACRTETDV